MIIKKLRVYKSDGEKLEFNIGDKYEGRKIVSIYREYDDFVIEWSKLGCTQITARTTISGFQYSFFEE